MSRITQEMKYRESIVKFALRFGVGKASRKYNRHRSYIYFWKARYDGTILSLAGLSKKPKSHPNEHTVEEIKLIRDMRAKNQDLGLIEFWLKLLDRGYRRTVTGLYRVMQKLGMIVKIIIKPKYIPKPYESMTHMSQ